MYIKSRKIFESESQITFDSIISQYTDASEFSDYPSKFIITKLLEFELTKSNDSRPAGLDTLSQYAPTLFSKEGIQKIRDYKNSSWIKALEIKLTTYQVNYPNIVSHILKEKGQYKAKEWESMITTNIGIFTTVVGELNKLLPEDIRFNFQFKGLTEITDKNFLKLILFYKEQLFSLEKIETYKKVIAGFMQHSQKSEELFVKYLKDKGIESRKAILAEDVKGIDVIDQNGVTYQVKAPKSIKVYNSGYFIPNSSQLDIRKIKDVDKLVFYISGNFNIVDTANIEIQQGKDGVFIKTLF